MSKQRKVMGARPPLQSRSRDTLNRFLSAAAYLLTEKNFEAATVQDIARLAKSSVGAFYLRFPDKEALLHHLTHDLFVGGKAIWDSFLDPERWKDKNAAEIIEEIIRVLVRKRVDNRGLLRALSLYCRARPESEFTKKSADLNLYVIEKFRDLMMTRKDEMSHSQPAQALDFALFFADSAIREAILFSDTGLIAKPFSEKKLISQLSCAVCSYLGVKRGVHQ